MAEQIVLFLFRKQCRISVSYAQTKGVICTQTIFAKLLYEMEKGRDTVLATIVWESGSAPRGAGAQMLVDAQGPQAGTIGGGNVENLSILHARELLKAGHGDIRDYKLRRSDTDDIGMICGGDVRVLFTYISAEDQLWHVLAATLLDCIAKYQPGYLVLPLSGAKGYLTKERPQAAEVFALPIAVGERAILFGAGHCSLALCPVLKSIGFRVTVFDDRADLVTAERFPDAERLICGDFASISRYITVEPEDYAVVMTNGHTHDFTVQEQILRQPTAYVGVIGSRTKTASVNQRLRAAGISQEAISSIHAPVGVAIKAVTPAEIAVSIAGEMIYERALRRERAGMQTHGCPMH